MKMIHRVVSAALAVALLAASAAAFAQGYPNRAVKIVVPWPPGQATDLAARIIADKLTQSMGQPFVADNKPGAGGSIGTDFVAKAAPDGYTILAASSGPVSIMPNVQKTPYDPLTQLTGVSLIAAAPFALVTAPNFPAANTREFIALVKANPDKYTFASSGTGATAHLISVYFNTMADLNSRHIPYKGSAPALTDVISGQVAYTFETVASVIGHVKSGRLKAYGVSFAKRSSAMPDVPTHRRIRPSGLRHRRVDRLHGAGRPTEGHRPEASNRGPEGHAVSRGEGALHRPGHGYGLQHARRNERDAEEGAGPLRRDREEGQRQGRLRLRNRDGCARQDAHNRHKTNISLQQSRRTRGASSGACPPTENRDDARRRDRQ